MKKYKCMNIGNCKIAGTKETFEIAEGEELVCPKCGSSMVVEVSGKKPLPFIIGGVVALGVLGGAGYAIFGGGDGESAEPAEPEGPAVVDTIPPVAEPQCTDSDYVDSVKIDDKTTYVYHRHRGADCNVETTKVDTIVKEEKPQTPKRPYWYDWATFDGTTMTFKKAHIIPGTNEMAQPGDKVQGVWKNGEVNSVRWYHADGRGSEVLTHK
jgi:hypothetical protein